MGRIVAIGISLSLLSGCTALPPVAEVRLVASAFDALNTASQPLLDDLALAERTQGRFVAETRAELRTDRPAAAGTAGRASPNAARPLAERCPDILLTAALCPDSPRFQTGFCEEDSYYYSELADPPATRAFRHGLGAVGDYTDLLLFLAEDRNIDEVKAQLRAVGGRLGVALAATGVASGGPAAAGALQGLQVAVVQTAKIENGQELGRAIKHDATKVGAVIMALRSSATEIFRTLTEMPMRRFSEEGLKHAEIARSEALRVEDYRIAVSNYVVLLDQYRALLADLVAAYDRPKNAITSANLVERSARLADQAEFWRRGLARARTGIH